MRAAGRLLVLIVLGAASCRGPVDSQGHERFRRDLGRATLTVFPAHVNHAGVEEWNANAATRIAELVRSAGWCDARTAGAEIPLPMEWHMNQARMLADGAGAFADWVRKYPIETQYALTCDYLLGDRAAVGVHVFVVDAQGTVVHVSLWNSHWEPFEDVGPKNAEDCTEVVLRGLREQWSELVEERGQTAGR